MASSKIVEAGASVDLASATPKGGFGRALGRLTEALALAGGALMLFVMVMVVVSIIGRTLFDTPITGDYEITELACGIAVFLFFPYTHITRQNIVAELFTSKLPEHGRTRLDGAHDLVFAGVAAFLSWRVFEGFLDKLASAETTVLLELPVWWAYLAAVFACAILAVACVWWAARLGFGRGG